MNYEIKGTPFPVVICKLADGERMITEKGAMVWMSPNMEMSTVGGGLGRMFSKAFSGESMFQNIYTARGDGMITFGSCMAKTAFDLKGYGKICSKLSIICSIMNLHARLSDCQ